MAARRDPYVNFNFLVEIDGITQAAFQEASGLDSTIDVIEHREGGENITTRKYPGQVKFSQHHPQVRADRRRRALRLAPAVGRRRPGRAAQERLDRAARPPGPGEGALELLQRLAEQVDRPDASTPSRTTSRSRRSRSPTKAWSAPEPRASTGDHHVPDRIRVHPALRLPRRRRHAAPRRRHAPGHRGRRDPAAEGPAGAEERGLSDRDPAVARGHAARQPAGDQPEGRSRACSRPTWRTCRTSTTGSTSCTTTARHARSAARRLRWSGTSHRRSARAGGVVGYPLDQLHEEVAFIAYHFHWSPEQIMDLEHRDRRAGSSRSRR